MVSLRFPTSSTSMVHLLSVNHTIQYSYICRQGPAARDQMISCSSPWLAEYVVSSSLLFISPPQLTSRPSFSALHTPHLSKGLSRGVNVGQWSVRRIFLVMPRLKCRCPYSASAMIELQSS